MSDDSGAIKNLVHSYAELLDTGDLERVGRLFERATFRVRAGAEELRGAKAVQQFLENTIQLYDGIPSTKHVITNVSVAVDEDRRSATARSYYTALQARPELSLQPILAGRWHDRFERNGGRWEFADRLIYTDLVGDLSFHIKGVARTPTD